MSSEQPPVLQIFNESGHPLPFSEAEAGQLLSQVSNNESAAFSMVELVYVDEDEIIRINKEHLDRNYVTDIISFRYEEDASNAAIEGTLYCCTPRIKEQASEYHQPEKKEFLRIFIHGLLHLVGYDDQTQEDKKNMTKLENQYLGALGFE